MVPRYPLIYIEYHTIYSWPKVLKIDKNMHFRAIVWNLPIVNSLKTVDIFLAIHPFNTLPLFLEISFIPHFSIFYFSFFVYSFCLYPASLRTPFEWMAMANTVFFYDSSSQHTNPIFVKWRKSYYIKKCSNVSEPNREDFYATLNV